jgi:hypothetical protein
MELIPRHEQLKLFNSEAYLVVRGLQRAIDNILYVHFGDKKIPYAQPEHDPFIDDLNGLPPDDVA